MYIYIVQQPHDFAAVPNQFTLRSRFNINTTIGECLTIKTLINTLELCTWITKQSFITALYLNITAHSKVLVFHFSSKELSTVEPRLPGHQRDHNEALVIMG